MSESCQFLCEQTKLPLVGYRRAGKLPCYMPIPAPPTSLTFPHRNQDQSSSERQRLKVRAHDEDDPLINPFVDSAPLLASLACGRVLMCIGEGVVLRGLAYYGLAQGQRLAKARPRCGRRPTRATRSTSWSRAATGRCVQDKVISDFLNR